MFILVLQSSRWGGERSLLCFFGMVVSNDYIVALPRGSMGLSAVSVCGVS